MITKRQQRRAERQKAKDARRSQRQQAAWEKERHKQRQQDPYRSVDWGYRPKASPVHTAMVAALALAASHLEDK